MVEQFDPHLLVFLSPSLAYAAHPCYAAQDSYRNHRAVAVLEFRMDPFSIRVGKSTLAHEFSAAEYKYCPKNSMEWYTDLTGNLLLTGILIKVSCPIDEQLNKCVPAPTRAVFPSVSTLQAMIKALEFLPQPHFRCSAALACWKALSTLSLNPNLFNHRFDEYFFKKLFIYLFIYSYYFYLFIILTVKKK